MKRELSKSEGFLTEFHDSRPGITSAAYGQLVAERKEELFGSSYESLADTVDGSHRKILDVACGDGFLMSVVADRVSSQSSLFGIDFSHGELKTAQNRLNGKVGLYRCWAQSLPFRSESIDNVLSHMALMLMDDLDGVIKEIRRVLVRGGRFSFIVGATSSMKQPAIEAYVARLSALRDKKNVDYLRFGDPRIRKVEGIWGILEPLFSEITVEDVTVRRRYTPLEIWDWFDGMYDLWFFQENDQDQLKEQYLSDIEGLRDSDGKIEFVDTLRQVSAIAV